VTFLLVPFEVGLTLLIAFQRAYVVFILRCLVVTNEGSSNYFIFLPFLFLICFLQLVGFWSMIFSFNF
jgi:hypothetical protein